MTDTLPSRVTPQGGTSASDAPAPFAATKRIGFVLNAEGGLHWLQASEVLKNLRDVQHPEFCKAHLRMITGNDHAAFFPDAAEIAKDEEAKESFTSSDQGGHLYRSATIRCDFAPDPADPSYRPFSLSLFFAYTVCVQLPWAENGPRQLHSKFWYNAIISPQTDHDSSRFDDDLAILSEQIDAISSEVLKTTLPHYEAGVKSVKPEMNFDHAARECNTIHDLCIEFPDEDFVAESAAYEKGKIKLSSAGSEAMKYLHKVVTVARAQDDDEQAGPLLKVGAKKIGTNVLIQRDYRGARALYVVTSDGDLEGPHDAPVMQRAFGVTSSYQPSIAITKSKRAVEKTLHARPSNSISAIRVNIEAAAL